MNVIYRHNLIPIVFIIFVAMLPSCSSSYFTYKEYRTVEVGYFTGAYADQTILFQVVYVNDLYNAVTSLRLIFPNQTLKAVDVPGFTKYSFLLNPNYIILFYEHTTRVAVRIVDWARNKPVISHNVPFKKHDLFVMAPNEEHDKFLIARYKKPHQLLYSEYIVNRYGRMKSTISGNLTLNEIDGVKITNIIRFKIFSLNGTWGILFRATLMGQKKSQCFFSIINTESKDQNLNLLRLTDTDDPRKALCISDKSNNFQYYCLVTTNIGKLKWVDINFNTLIVRSNDLFPFISFDATSLHVMPDVGFLVEVSLNIRTKLLILNSDINYLDSNNAFGEMSVNNTNNIFTGNNIFILPHNRIIRGLLNGTSLIFDLIDLSPTIPKNNPYNNTHIKRLYPSKNDLIPVGTNKINITFLNAIDPTTGVNISIYHDDVIREKVLCTNPYCVISKDSFSLTITLLNTTFNEPNASYDVEISDGFVRYKNELTTVPGIKLGNWIIKTLPEYNATVKEDKRFTAGILRLNLAGTTEFNKLDTDEQDEFFERMRIELSYSIPVDPSRINMIKHIYQYDAKSDSDLLLISFSIDHADNSNKRTAKDVLNDLDLLIKTKDIVTPLDTYDTTRYIDKDYGFQRTSNLMEEIKSNLKNFAKETGTLIMSIIIVVLIFACYIFGRYKHRKGSNMIIFKVALIIFDTINDILFVLTSKDNLNRLYVPSVIFLALPLTMNTLLTFMILSFEITQYPEFHKWFKSNSKLAAIVTLISSGNIELLHLFDSNFGGLKAFSAQFSPLALNWIFWGGFVNIFLEDIPQLIIQIIHAITFTSSYTIIAFLTLITSSIVLMTNLIEYAYKFVNKYFKEHDGHETFNTY